MHWTDIDGRKGVEQHEILKLTSVVLASFYAKILV
jgi:hypothetical protein